MFQLRYLLSELRRRRGRTIFTVLGLGVGVGLVITVTALSRGLDDAQEEILDPLTGVGTEMTVNRPISFEGGDPSAGGGPGEGLSASEQRQLEKENGSGALGFDQLADPGERFSTDQYLSADLSFPSSEAKRVSQLDDVDAVSAALTVDVLHLEGRTPESGSATAAPFGAAPPGGEGWGWRR